MNQILFTFSALVLITSLSACATDPFLPVTDPARRIDLNGASVEAPRGTGWKMATSPDGTRVFYIKTSPDERRQAERKHTMIASARTKDLGRSFANAEEYRSYVEKEQRDPLSDPARYTIVELKSVAVTEPASVCIRFDMLWEDRGVAGYHGTPFVGDAQALHCLHPRNPRQEVVIGYSERRLKDDPPLTVTDELNPFMRSLRF